VNKLIRTFALALIILPAACLAQSYIPGYRKAIAGEELQYHAPQPDATVSLLVRSEDEARYIEWETASVPENPKSKSQIPDKSQTSNSKTRNQKLETRNSKPETRNQKPETFLMLAGIDVNPDDPQEWTMWVDDVPFFTIPTPRDTNLKTLEAPGPDGSLLVFEASQVDRYGDFMGYLYVTLPARYLTPGKPVRFRVTGSSAGSRTWFMVFMYEAVNAVTLTSEQAVQRGDDGEFQVLRAEIVHYGKPVKSRISIGGKVMKQRLGFGYNSLYLPVPRITEPKALQVGVKAGKEMLCDREFVIEPVKERTIYLLHHSHNDIGYTHVQHEVERMQWENLDRALELSERTRDYPPGAQLKWCTEVMWAVASYYDSLAPDKKASFCAAVREGRIELNALFAGELTGLCGPEELDRLLEDGRRIARDCGVELTSAMITDIPGWSWAIVPALARSGVKYLSLGTNRGHRIGDIIDALGDRPFYWSSPSGEEKVLCWVHGAGYSLFHTGLAYNSIQKRLREDLVFGYLDELSRSGYPYEEVMLRYNIGSDNGPVDELLPDAVKAWNEKYVTPGVVISSVGEAFALFEERHGTEIPGQAGDITGYWEDGAYSTARETAMNRHSAARLTQAGALWAMYNPQGYPEERFREAWKNVLLFNEHTWGSWNSISEPESPFTLQQWEIKKQFALEAEKQSEMLRSDALISRALGGPAAGAIEVINTCAWSRSGLVVINWMTDPISPFLLTSAGDTIPAQILSSGDLAFIARDVPGLGSAVYTVGQLDSWQLDKEDSAVSGSQVAVRSEGVNNRTIEQSSNVTTSQYSLQIDTLTGAIWSLKWQGKELVDTSRFAGLNQYLYVEGRFPDNPLPANVKNISLIDDGPVVKTIRIESEAPGCNSIATDLQIIDELNTVKIINRIDKRKEYEPEAVHIAFPFHIPGGQIRYDLAYGWGEPEKDQLPGSNKNFLCMEHWVDVSNTEHGLTLICPDAPLFEVGEITMDGIVTGWRDSIPSSQTVLSYLMNNYWETNYAAAQEGPGTYSYILRPHDGFDAAAAEKAAIEARQPLIGRIVGDRQQEMPLLININDNNSDNSIIITSIRPVNEGKDLIITLYNAGEEDEVIEIQHTYSDIYLTDPDGIESEPIQAGIRIPPQGNLSLKLIK